MKKVKWGAVKIRHKIIFVFLSLMILTTCITLMLTWYEYQKNVKKQVSDFSNQTLHALDNSLQLIVEHVEQESYTLFWNPAIQEILFNIGNSSPTPQDRATVEGSLINMMLSGEYISSVILYDEDGNSYDCLRSGSMVKKNINLEEMPWYDAVIEMDGEFAFVLNSGTADFYPQGNVLSMIKVIKSQEDYSRLGIVIINIAESAVHRYFEDIGGESGVRFYVMDQEQVLFGPKEDRAGRKQEWEQWGRFPQNQYVKLNGEQYFANSIASRIDGWHIISVSPVSRIKPRPAMELTLLLIAVNLILVSVCGEYIRHILSKPLKRMEEHIAEDEKGDMRLMEVEEGSCDEISELKRVYNRMQGSIRQLLDKTREDAEIIKKNELDLIRAQLNPHFLYNTLDAISAMALIGDKDNCFKMTRALAMFYRDTLSRGSDLISIKDEIKCIVNYMTIINMRSDTKIQTEYKVEKELEREQVLKLLLQPFVENAAQHGLRGMEGGIIRITAGRNGEWVWFKIWDNGRGMDKEQIEAVLSGRNRSSRSGFGIYGAVERIRLFYGVENPIMIKSQPGEWTEITIQIRSMGEKIYGN